MLLLPQPPPTVPCFKKHREAFSTMPGNSNNSCSGNGVGRLVIVLVPESRRHRMCLGVLGGTADHCILRHPRMACGLPSTVQVHTRAGYTSQLTFPPRPLPHRKGMMCPGRPPRCVSSHCKRHTCPSAEKSAVAKLKRRSPTSPSAVKTLTLHWNGGCMSSTFGTAHKEGAYRHRALCFVYCLSSFPGIFRLAGTRWPKG